MHNKKPLFSEKLMTLLVEIGKKISNECLSNLFAIEAAYKLEKISEEDASKSITMLDYRLEKGDILISYLAIGKTPEYTVNNKWARKNRQQGKVGKTILTFIKYYCKLLELNEPSAKEVEDFVNLFKAALSSGNYEFKLVKGEEIAFYYNEDNYYKTSNGGHTLFSSCMRHNECQKYFDIYKHNDHCELLIMFDKSLSSTHIVGRALVWTQDGKKYVDRRYFCLDLYEVAMVDYIKSQQWSYKSENTFDDVFNTSFYEFNSEKNKYELNNSCDIVVPVKFTPNYYPYMDTVKYYDHYSQLITNNENNVSEFIVLNSPDGSYEGRDNVICECCGRSINIEDSIYISDYGYYCDDCATYDYFGEPRLIEELITVYGKNNREYLLHEDDVYHFAVHYEGEWYAIPGTRFLAYEKLVIYDRSDYTDEEFEVFTENHEIINDTYALMK